MVDQDLTSFELGFDSFTRNVARTVNNFFRQDDFSINNSLTEDEFSKKLFEYMIKNHTVFIDNLHTRVKQTDSGYTGVLKSTMLKQPLFFEITS